jgi:hypothetical protein
MMAATPQTAQAVPPSITGTSVFNMTPNGTAQIWDQSRSLFGKFNGGSFGFYAPSNYQYFLKLKNSQTFSIPVKGTVASRMMEASWDVFFDILLTGTSDKPRMVISKGFITNPASPSNQVEMAVYQVQGTTKLGITKTQYSGANGAPQNITKFNVATDKPLPLGRWLRVSIKVDYLPGDSWEPVGTGNEYVSMSVRDFSTRPWVAVADAFWFDSQVRVDRPLNPTTEEPIVIGGNGGQAPEIQVDNLNLSWRGWTFGNSWTVPPYQPPLPK